MTEKVKISKSWIVGTIDFPGSMITSSTLCNMRIRSSRKTISLGSKGSPKLVKLAPCSRKSDCCTSLIMPWIFRFFLHSWTVDPYCVFTSNVGQSGLLKYENDSKAFFKWINATNDFRKNQTAILILSNIEQIWGLSSTFLTEMCNPFAVQINWLQLA